MYEIRVVERFETDEYKELRRMLLVENSTFIETADAFGEDVRGVDERPNPLRIGAYGVDGQLVGFTFGWQQGEGRFYMAISAVRPEFQRQGIYSALLERAVEAARARGYCEVWSRHLPDNAPILIAKLKKGFMIVGLEMSVQFGMQVHLALPLNQGRADALAFRLGSRPLPVELTPWVVGVTE